MARLLKQLAKGPQERSYARMLLAAFDGRSAPRQTLIEPLSGRELEVLRLLASELSGPDIASELFVSLNTLRTHTKNIYAKLGVTSRRAAVRRASELGLVGAAPG
jgi:LuxR family maltose regulon positive regulatory protein